MKSLFQITDRLAMKTNRITNPNDVSKQDSIIWIKFNFCRVAVLTKCVHIITPTLVKNSLSLRFTPNRYITTTPVSCLKERHPGSL